MFAKRSIVSFIVASCISFIILLTLNDFGITWDEPIYFRNADRYVSWIKHPIFEKVNKSFEAAPDDVHPPFRKLIAGVTHSVLTTQLKIVDNTRGYRISSLVFVFPFIFIFTYVAIGYVGYLFGILVTLMFSLMPHVLFLTPLVTLDYAVTALWFMAVIAMMKGMKNYRWVFVSAICTGCAMLTKFHGYILFIPLGITWLVFFWERLISHTRFKKKIHFFLPLVYLIFGALVIYFIGWPWLWTELVPHLKEYFSLQFFHVGVPVMIFGHIFTHVPWWYVPTMFFVTTPAFIVCFFLFGLLYVVKKGSLRDRLFLMHALFPIIFFMLPIVNRYDWIRLFLPAFPFVCLIAGRGMVVAIKLLKKQTKISGTIIVILLWMVTVYFSVIRIHPWESAYYNEFVGGISGAYRLGFETEFWGNAYKGILPWMNANKKDMMCVKPTTQPFYYYQAMGQIEGGVVFNAGIGACKYVVILMRQGFFIQDAFIDAIVKTRKPIHAVSVDGVPLVGVYDITDTTH
ncbi:MAG: hypothetical protein V1917_01555 [Candidatus Gottesmanbacteria bacterium]